jgi:hypothetical protein
MQMLSNLSLLFNLLISGVAAFEILYTGMCIYSPNFDSFVVHLDLSVISYTSHFIFIYLHSIEKYFMCLLFNCGSVFSVLVYESSFVGF